MSTNPYTPPGYGGQVTIPTAYLQKIVPGFTGVSQGFGPTIDTAEPNVYGTGPFHAGIDLAAPQGSPVDLGSSGTYVGTASNGYVDIFRDDITQVYEYYQHIVSAPLKLGTDYAAGTQIGTIANPGYTPPGTDYSSSGPHLEIGIATSAITEGNGLYPAFAYVDPNAAFTQDSQGIGSLLKPVSTAAHQLGQVGNAADAVQTPQATALEKGNVGPILGQLGNAISFPIIGGVSIGGTLALAGLGLLGIVLVYALVKGGDK